MPKFYPRLSKLISFEKLPTIFSGLNDIFDKLYFRNFQTIKSIDGVSVSYVIEIISYKELKIDIAGSGFSLLLNPDFESDGASAFPLSLNTRWGIRKYIKNFNIAFGESSQEFFDTFFEVVTMEDSELIMAASLVFIDDTEDLLTAFLNDFNDFYTTSYTLTDSSDFEGSMEEFYGKDANKLKRTTEYLRSRDIGITMAYNINPFGTFLGYKVFKFQNSNNMLDENDLLNIENNMKYFFEIKFLQWLKTKVLATTPIPFTSHE